MACGYATLSAFSARERTEYACVGVPPEKEVTPEPRENGAMLAAIARVLRDVFGTARGAARVELRPRERGPEGTSRGFGVTPSRSTSWSSAPVR